ncbi:MAG: TIGR04283 family arsenosugar biosynthesis glycosyltransferase [Candidatus Competibacteraceae bacterium]|nr:TIGR04283 family arsenosugar biosynthesis glycosyltransferase [Candidatus Competibacteraceae bacterium]
MSRITIVLPVLNEEAQIAVCLHALQPLREQGCELIVADGGSRDRTLALAEPLADRLVSGPRGRAAQMNAGARQADGEILWFLHADSLPPPDVAGLIRAALTDPNRHWGRFDVRLSGRQPLLRMVETLMNVRSRLTGIATGDQGIFVRRALFERIGGFSSSRFPDESRPGWPGAWEPVARRRSTKSCYAGL